MRALQPVSRCVSNSFIVLSLQGGFRLFDILKHQLLQSTRIYDLLWYGFRLHHWNVAVRSAEWWKRTRNIHRGRRGFVIGNGPSLKITDLHRLQGDVCIASNKIYLAFDETPWRPNYLTCGDKLVWDKIQPDLPGKFSEIITISTMDIRLASIPVIVARHLGGHASVAEGFSSDCGLGMYGGRTVTYNNLQLAAHLGLNPIFLIGCDHYYQGESGVNVAGQVVQHTSSSNHFSPKYRNAGEKVNSAPIGEMNAAFEVARRVSKVRNIEIYNATRGGYLEIFDRVTFDSLF